ncbi:MAG: Nin1 binding protein [Claussenomyces sp. TS43310]|nr:MAG: Nin1 binding protein [Claussenomyces sp. TS43310]
METKTIKAVHSLVLDANPILRNEPSISTLLGQSEQLYTIPAVIEEIRDATARARIETTLLPFVTLRTPKSSSIKVVADFARRTGDLEVLSKPDIQILALAYELECERNHGDWRLRSMPGQKRTNGPPPASLADLSPNVPNTDEGETLSTETRQVSGTPSTLGTASTDDVVSDKAKVEAQSHVEQESSVGPTASPLQALENLTIQSAPTSLEIERSPPESEASDDEGWITPSNISQQQDKDRFASDKAHSEPKVVQVATITADFAMQNVLLRMNLNLLSPSMQRIRQLKTWVLRCHACFDITKDMSKEFCSRCGKPTLLRTSCSTDQDGNFKVHLKKNMQWNTRGDVFSIPKPVAGSANGKRSLGGGKGGWGQSLILAEDQKEFVEAVTTARRRKEKDLMDEDYLPGILSGDRRGPGGRPRVGAGRNINSRKRR